MASLPTDGRTFKYKCYGNVLDCTGSLILIPGLDGAAAFFADVIPELMASGFHVVQYFLPLKTEEIAASHYTFDFIARDLCDVTEELGIKKCILVGESFG